MTAFLTASAGDLYILKREDFPVEAAGNTCGADRGQGQA
jgi:hypothetical protein